MFFGSLVGATVGLVMGVVLDVVAGAMTIFQTFIGKGNAWATGFIVPAGGALLLGAIVGGIVGAVIGGHRGPSPMLAERPDRPDATRD